MFDEYLHNYRGSESIKQTDSKRKEKCITFLYHQEPRLMPELTQIKV